MHQYFLYIVASYSRRTYVGVTNNLERRIWQHKTGELGGHTSKYRKHRLVHVEEFQWIQDAIAREKQIKGWDRQNKEALVESENPNWEDLSAGWFDDRTSRLGPFEGQIPR